jgi:hypothetical protein
MSRLSQDVYKEGQLVDGFDYELQCWVIDGRIVDCGHPQTMECSCSGRTYKDELLSHVKMVLAI